MVDVFNLLNEVFKIVGAVRQILLPIGIVLIIGGLLFAFFGRKIFEFLLFVIGGSFMAGAIIIFFGPRAGLPATLFLGILGFVAGGILTYYIFYLLIFGIGVSVGALLGILILRGDVSSFPAVFVVLVLASIFGGLAVMIFQLTLAISSAMTGAYVASIGVFILTGSSESSTVFGIIFAIAGAFFQIFFLEAFAEHVEKATESAAGGIFSRFTFGGGFKRTLKIKPIPKPNPSEIILEFSIEEEERHFQDLEERRKADQISKQASEIIAVGILDKLQGFIIACDKEVASLAKKSEDSVATQIKIITNKRDRAKKVHERFKNTLRDWQKQRDASYIT